MDRLIRRTTAEQVADAIEAAIANREFEPGGRLPPERKLAAMLGVGRLTLREGLNRLTGRGVLVAVPGLGTWVASMETGRSIEAMPSVYLREQRYQRRFELLKQFLEFRRHLLADILGLVCTRSSEVELDCIVDAFQSVLRIAEFDGDVGRVQGKELAALHLSSEVVSAWPFWLTLNTVRRFYTVAQKDLCCGVSLERVKERVSALMKFLGRRDGAGIRRYVEEVIAADDLRLMRGFHHQNAPPEFRERRPDGSEEVGTAPEGTEEPSVEPEPRGSGELVRAEEATVSPAGPEDERAAADQPTPWEREFYDPEFLATFLRREGRYPWDMPPDSFAYARKWGSRRG